MPDGRWSRVAPPLTSSLIEHFIGRTKTCCIADCSDWATDSVARQPAQRVGAGSRAATSEGDGAFAICTSGACANTLRTDGAGRPCVSLGDGTIDRRAVLAAGSQAAQTAASSRRHAPVDPHAFASSMPVRVGSGPLPAFDVGDPMTCFPRLAAALGIAMVLASCAAPDAEHPAAATAPAPISGERIAYVVGCVNCHHQTPKEILNAPPLVVVQGYSLAEFTTLLRTGVTRDGRDMYAQGSIMGIVAREQLSHLTPDEVSAVHRFLQKEWTAERGLFEEAKIATFPPPTFGKQ
jgi:hypothetical protein